MTNSEPPKIWDYALLMKDSHAFWSALGPDYREHFERVTGYRPADT